MGTNFLGLGRWREAWFVRGLLINICGFFTGGDLGGGDRLLRGSRKDGVLYFWEI